MHLSDTDDVRPADGGPGIGPRLASTTSALLRSAIPEVPTNAAIPLGPGFDYAACPDLFLGRSGHGPLHVVWDTNLLIDYFAHGTALWNGDPLPDLVPGHGEELEGLQLIIGLWVLRDIRFRILSRVLTDAKRRLPGERRAEREKALQEFAAALEIAEWYDASEPTVDVRQDSAAPLPLFAPSDLEAALRSVPEGADRELVREANAVGAHIFLTRDLGVLRAAEAFRDHRLLIASPLDLLEELVASGSFHCMLHPVYAYWMTPDLQRVTHLIRALPDSP